jgi:peroxiredoxin
MSRILINSSLRALKQQPIRNTYRSFHITTQRPFKSSPATMSGLVEKVTGAVKPLSKGSKLPTSALKEDNPEKATVNISQLSGTNVVVGVPGAFTPPCSSQVPGYSEHASKFAEKGVKGIYVVAVNDAFTTQAWKEKLGVKSDLVHFLADDTGDV